MNADDLCEEVAVELEALDATVRELMALRQDVAHTEPTTREKTAAAAFLAQFYNGVENILKRISLYHNAPLPSGETWHVDLFQRFCTPPFPGLPALFDERLASDLAPFRRFRHVVFHSYGFQLDWSRMAEGVVQVEDIFSRFKLSPSDYLGTIETQ